VEQWAAGGITKYRRDICELRLTDADMSANNAAAASAHTDDKSEQIVRSSLNINKCSLRINASTRGRVVQ